MGKEGEGKRMRRRKGRGREGEERGREGERERVDGRVEGKEKGEGERGSREMESPNIILSLLYIPLSPVSQRGWWRRGRRERKWGSWSTTTSKSDASSLLESENNLLIFTISLLAVATDHTIILILITTFTPFLLTLHTK